MSEQGHRRQGMARLLRIYYSVVIAICIIIIYGSLASWLAAPAWLVAVLFLMVMGPSIQILIVRRRFRLKDVFKPSARAFHLYVLGRMFHFGAVISIILWLTSEGQQDKFPLYAALSFLIIGETLQIISARRWFGGL